MNYTLSYKKNEEYYRNFESPIFLIKENNIVIFTFLNKYMCNFPFMWNVVFKWVKREMEVSNASIVRTVDLQFKWFIKSVLYEVFCRRKTGL